MKMARASKADIDLALDVSRALEDLERGHMPAAIATGGEDELEWFDEDNDEQCRRVVALLLDLVRRGSIFRVTFGMSVALDPRNELLDPEADTLEVHPKIERTAAERDALLAAMTEARQALQFANDAPKGPIRDTIWMMHGPETLFDFMDAAIESAGCNARSGGATLAQPVPDLFYLQDSRTYVGNDVMWWAKEGNGYTTDLRKAEVYTREQAQAQHNMRPSDVPWPKAYIDAKARPAVDMQYIKRAEALEGSGIALVTPKPQKRETLHCVHCGSFLSERQLYGRCPRCGGENRP